MPGAPVSISRSVTGVTLGPTLTHYLSRYCNLGEDEGVFPCVAPVYTTAQDSGSGWLTPKKSLKHKMLQLDERLFHRRVLQASA